MSVPTKTRTALNSLEGVPCEGDSKTSGKDLYEPAGKRALTLRRKPKASGRGLRGWLSEAKGNFISPKEGPNRDSIRSIFFTGRRPEARSQRRKITTAGH